MPSANSPKQLPLIRAKDLGRNEHGGHTRSGLRKAHRPFSPDAAIHVVLKSDRARGDWSLLHRRNRAHVETLIHRHARKTGVTVYRHSNVGNHLHLLVKAPIKPAFQRYLRSISGLIARHVTQTTKGHSLSKALRSGEKNADANAVRNLFHGSAVAKPRFWSSIPFTRLVHWGREYIALKAYLAKNRLEAVGFGGAVLRLVTNSIAAKNESRSAGKSAQTSIIVIGAPDFKLGPGGFQEWARQLRKNPAFYDPE